MGRTPKKRRDNGASLTPLLGSIQCMEGPTEHHRLGLEGRNQHRHPGLGLGGQWKEAIRHRDRVVFYNKEEKYNMRATRQRDPQGEARA